MTVLTKSAILEGINKVEKVEIKSLDAEMWLRPLSAAELDEIEAIEAKGMGVVEQNTTSLQAAQSVKLDVFKITTSSAKAKYEKICKSLDNPKNQDDPWTVEEIQQLPKSAINEINDKVNELSGVEVTSQDVKKFPENK